MFLRRCTTVYVPLHTSANRFNQMPWFRMGLTPCSFAELLYAGPRNMILAFLSPTIRLADVIFKFNIIVVAIETNLHSFLRFPNQIEDATSNNTTHFLTEILQKSLNILRTFKKEYDPEQPCSHTKGHRNDLTPP